MFLEIKAIGSLSHWVECYWEASIASGFWLPPDGTFHLLYSPAPLWLSGQESVWLAPGFYLLPLQQSTLQLSAALPIWGARLKAFALPIFLSSELLDERRGLHHIPFFPQTAILQQVLRLLEPEMSLAERIPCLELLLQEPLLARLPHEGLRDKVNYILFKKGQVSIEEMSKEFAISRQALHKIFTQSLRLSPKVLANIWQFNHFLSLIQADSSLTVSALDAGYYDQAHGIRDFKQRLSFPPSQLLKQPHPSLSFARQGIRKRFDGEYDPS